MGIEEWGKKVNRNLDDWNDRMQKKLDNSIERTKEEHKTKMAAIKEKQHEPKQSETEKLAKTGNFLVRGIALWYLLPFIGVAIVLAIFVGVWIWDSFMSLF